MVEEQKKASSEAHKASKTIEKAIDEIHRHLLIHSMGRIIYAGYDFCQNRCPRCAELSQHLIGQLNV